MLPILLLCLGDSIRLGWGAYIPCTQPKENCQSTRYAMPRMREWTGGKHYSVVVFNFGLHDIRKQVPLAEYKQNLNVILDQIHADRIYFCTTTACPEGAWHNNEAIRSYNQAALEVMNARRVKIIDLYALTVAHPEWQKGIHYTPEGYREMAELIKRAITPAILCLGDSICGGWAERVGWEHPHHNCRSTRYGVAHLSEWMHSRSYQAIVFNFGLWDIKEGVPLDEYKRNLNLIIDCLKADQLYFCTTTPGRANEERGRTPEAVERYNRAALEVMAARGVKIIDLHALCLRHRDWWNGDVHYSDEGFKQMADYVKHAIETPEQKGSGR